VSEFDLIRKYFTWPASRGDVSQGVGDDGALLRVPAGHELVVCVDTLVAGVHFPVDTPADAVGHKALAVNLSDLAAMGAEPAWATLALTVPEADEAWVGAFAQGFHALAREYDVDLVGGDTTRGPLSITVQVMGFVPQGQALRRDGARPGDAIYVTGTVGDAVLGLRKWQEGAVADAAISVLLDRLMRPTPRIAAGRALRGLAHAAIDVSDGVLADLGHVLGASGVGATLELDCLPLSDAFRAVSGDAPDRTLPLSGGDDYELLFTLPPERASQLEGRLGVSCTRIGTVEADAGLRVVDAQGRPVQTEHTGYEHFA
jgi:thiamine-monophosphate kinase